GNTGTPPLEFEEFFGLIGGLARPRRAKAEITCPAVPPSRCANSLAACSTSSSMSRVVLIHLMLLHHCINVNPCPTAAPFRVGISPPTFKHVRSLVLLRRYRRRSGLARGVMPIRNRVRQVVHRFAIAPLGPMPL